ncbi:MAG TPA: hypothetical protein VH413_18070 [Verrucomicrobiae bacterium]|nr:hypothetical protein [Verrucomicrobiae bacterium]
MNNDETLILTGILTGCETATIVLTPKKYHADGIDILISVKALEYGFNAETFYFGCILDGFLQEAERVISGQANRAHLFNSDGTLTLEFINNDNRTFLSATYTSIFPQKLEDSLWEHLKSASCLDSKENDGSQFSFSFMQLHNSITEISDWLTHIFSKHSISKESPFSR